MSNQDQCYNANPYVKRDGVQQHFSEHEISEYIKCSNDPCYFINNYVKIRSLDKGLTQFKLRGYQDKLIKQIHENRFSIAKACRQSGKSTTSIAYLAWFVLFNADKEVGILANKGATAREMLSRILLLLENIPFFLQPGCKELNKGSIKFSNNSKIIAAATSASSIRGLALDLILLDEFAFVNDAATFYASTYPVITSGANSKVIITSTPNGIGNMFHKLWEGSVNKTNDFIPFTINWWDVPGRDEAWKKTTIANTSEQQFKQEFSCEFLGSSDTLISGDCLLGLQAIPPIKTQNEVKYYTEPFEGRHYIMTVDVAKGRGQDFSTFNIFDATTSPFEQVAVFKDNNISPLLFPDIIVRNAKMYNDALVIIENNDAGHIVCNAVYHEYEYENTFVESAVKALGVGVTMSKRVKRIGCSNLKDLVESGKLMLRDADTIIELCSFEAKNGSYEASGNNHDDLVMNLVLFAWYISTAMFQDGSSINLKDLLYADRIREMEYDVVPFGFMPVHPDDTTADIYAKMAEQQREWNLT